MWLTYIHKFILTFLNIHKSLSSLIDKSLKKTMKTKIWGNRGKFRGMLLDLAYTSTSYLKGLRGPRVVYEDHVKPTRAT